MMRLTAIAVLLGTLACARGVAVATGPATDVRVAETFELQFGETAVIGGTGLALTFAEIVEDSRCPRDVTCVWEGRALLRLAARYADDTSSLLLGTTPDSARSAAAGAHIVHFVSLNEPPRDTVPVPPASYRVTLRVERAVPAH